MGHPPAVLAFKLLDASKITHRDRQLVLTAVNYMEKETLFNQMKASLRTFHGEQSMSNDTEGGIKLEIKAEDVLYQSKFGNRYSDKSIIEEEEDLNIIIEVQLQMQVEIMVGKRIQYSVMENLGDAEYVILICTLIKHALIKMKVYLHYLLKTKRKCVY